MSKKPKHPIHFNASDHEDWENEYYYRKSSGGILGFIFLGAGIALGIIVSIIHWLFF